MTLEDFFTLTEMKDGLTASDRVKELVNVMLNEKNCVQNNSCDAVRQWYTVASTIAATEDQGCLDLFVQLDGIQFISRWLKDAQKFGGDANSSISEESVIALLNALEKLNVNYEQSMSYGIWMSVENLLSHNSAKIQERARALFDGWKQLVGGEGGQAKSREGDIDEEKHVQTGDEMEPTVCSISLLPRKEDDVKNQAIDEEKASDHEFMKDGGSILKPVEESLHDEGEKQPRCLEGNDSHNICSSSVVPEQDGQESQMQEVASPSNDLVAMEISPCPSVLGKAPESVIGNDLQADTDTKYNHGLKDHPMGNTMDVDGTPVHRSQDQDCDTNVLDCSGDLDRLPEHESPDTSSSSKEASDSTNHDHSTSEESGGLSNYTHFLNNTKTNAMDKVVVNKSRSDFEMNYGMVDALEVARQVAIEVEREVEGRRETSCSSSRKNPEAETRQVSDSSDSVHGEEIETVESVPEESSKKNEELLNGQKDPNDDAGNCVQHVESSQLPNTVRELENKSEKGTIGFDLNEEIFSDDNDRPLDPISTPVSIVSASRAAAATGFPSSPLQFDGAHGWKGSAATSAFRPASPRKTHDSDKTLTVSGSENSSKHRQDFLDFDLNTTEDGEDRITDLMASKEIPRSGESSGEAKLNLDLNRISDEGDAPPDYRVEERNLLGRNGHHNASPSSSSSSMYPSLRNFDLNDQPSFLNDSSEMHMHPFFGKSSSQRSHSSLGTKSSSNVISIMGMKVEVNRKDLLTQPQTYMPNGKSLEPALDINLARGGGVLGIGSAVPYPHPSYFAYNGLANGPTGTFSPVMYGPTGPIPYVVDSRVGPVVPQYLGSASTPPASYPQPPFATGIYGMPPPGLNGPGPSRPNFDLNSGLMIERVNRESGVLRQFLNPVQRHDELRPNFHPSSSLGVGKRKEPDGGWEQSYPIDYKRHHPQWK